MRGFEAELQPSIDGIDLTAQVPGEERVIKVDTYPVRANDLEGREEHRLDVALHRLGSLELERHFRGPNGQPIRKPSADQQLPLQ